MWLSKKTSISPISKKISISYTFYIIINIRKNPILYSVINEHILQVYENEMGYWLERCLLSCMFFSQAADNVNGTQYHILLILTDGAISDMPATKQAIVEVCWCTSIINNK